MSYRIIAGIAALIGISAGLILAFARTGRSNDGDFVAANVLTRINTEYHDLQ